MTGEAHRPTTIQRKVATTRLTTIVTPKVYGKSSDEGAVMTDDNSQKALRLFSNLQRGHSGLNNQQQRSVQELHNRAAATL
jgi:CheY-specific phosphatase CheX